MEADIKVIGIRRNNSSGVPNSKKAGLDDKIDERPRFFAYHVPSSAQQPTTLSYTLSLPDSSIPTLPHSMDTPTLTLLDQVAYANFDGADRCCLLRPILDPG